MRRLFVLASLSVLTATAASRQSPAQAIAATVRPLPYTRFVLPNGLTAILNEDHASPIASVDVFYRIGSRDDPPGRIGIAHFCEHIISEGSPNLELPQGDFYTTLGGTSARQAETSEDITHYYVVIPSHQLETVIWTEGDRLRNKLSKTDSATLTAVRAVIAQERLSTVEGAPLEFVGERQIVAQALFPVPNPYNTSMLSPMHDLPTIDAAAMRESCGPYYVPNNAVIAVSGDFDTGSVKQWIAKYFSDIPRGAPVKRAPVPEAPIPNEQRLVLEDPSLSVPQLRMNWRGAAYDNPDRAALLALASSLSLARFASDGHLASVGVEAPVSLGRLSKLLVQDRQLATRVLIDNYDLERAGVFEIAIYPRANASLTTIETLVDSVMSAMAESPVTKEELALFNSYNTVQIAAALQPRFARSDTLAHDEIFAGNPTAYAKQAMSARVLTAEDIERVRKRYLTSGRVVVSLVPAGKVALASKPDLPFTNATPAYAKPKP
ncbi:MAG TPA: pitrilysin family protein [Gemmatimonadaceae bacterium]|jgi:zinc protease